MSLTGKGLAEFAIKKLGTPYVYGAKGANGVFTDAQLKQLMRSYPGMFTTTYIAKAKKRVGKVCCDCSGLISWYTDHVLGSAQLYSAASKRGLISDIKNAPIGAVLWHEGHVGVYIGNGMCVEEKGIDYGCVESKVSNTRFTHWLLFSWIDYDKSQSTSTSKKDKNPYDESSSIIKYGDEGESVKWLQWELKESGYKITIDGIFGLETSEALGKFQHSCKITVDYICGEKTRKELKRG